MTAGAAPGSGTKKPFISFSDERLFALHSFSPA
jgi:hypothetical protein